MVEKLQIILTFSRKAKLYVLDEPLGGIDLISREHVLELILQFYREDCTILISTHLINEVENIFDEVIFLKDGEIVLYENVEELRFQRGKRSQMCLRRCLVDEAELNIHVQYK